MFWCLVSTLLLGFSGMIAYIYYLKNGQFDDVEDVKYQMFRDENKE